MLYSEIIAVCSQIHTKHINTLCGQNVEFCARLQNCEKRLLPSLCLRFCFRPSVRPHGTARFALDGFWWKLIFELFSENLSRRFKFHQNWTVITGTLHEDVFTYITILAEFLLEWEMFRIKVVEETKTHILYSVTFFPKILPFMRKCRKIWRRQRGHIMTIRRIRVGCWISQATRAQARARALTHIRVLTPSWRTHFQNYVIRIAFQQQLFCERASVLRYACIACLVECVSGMWRVKTAGCVV